MSKSLADISDSSLIERLRRRDARAMMDLYDRYGKLIYSIVLRAVKDSAIAEDITQEAFLRVWNRIGTFKEEKGNFEGWLVTVARNRAFDYLRAVRKSPETMSVNPEDWDRIQVASPHGDATERVTNQQAILAAIEALNADQRAVIELTHFEGMSQTEIAMQLHKPLGTVKGLVRSALKALRSAMEGAAV